MKLVNTPEEILKNQNNGDIEFVENMKKEHPTTLVELNEPGHTNQWCPGCGDFGILFAIKKAIVTLGIDPSNVVVVSGIGCSSKLPHYIKTFGVESLHGRALPVATGVKLANNKLNVFVFTGDGDCLGEGGNHFIHAARKNIDITCIIHDNQVYALTVGQSSPTSQKGFKTKIIDGEVPLSEMFGYATALRSLTEGRGTSTMEFSHYQEVPKNIAQEIIEGKRK